MNKSKKRCRVFDRLKRLVSLLRNDDAMALLFAVREKRCDTAGMIEHHLKYAGGTERERRMLTRAKELLEG